MSKFSERLRAIIEPASRDAAAAEQAANRARAKEHAAKKAGLEQIVAENVAVALARRKAVKSALGLVRGVAAANAFLPAVDASAFDCCEVSDDAKLAAEFARVEAHNSAARAKRQEAGARVAHTLLAMHHQDVAHRRALTAAGLSGQDLHEIRVIGQHCIIQPGHGFHLSANFAGGRVSLERLAALASGGELEPADIDVLLETLDLPAPVQIEASDAAHIRAVMGSGRPGSSEATATVEQRFDGIITDSDAEKLNLARSRAARGKS